MLLWFVEKKLAPEAIGLGSPERDRVLGDCGLLDVAGDAKTITRADTPGPTGQRGTIVAFPSTDLPGHKQLLVGYFPDKQEWTKCAGGKYWCGKLKDERTAPETLRRSGAVEGYRVRLLDGQDWDVARAVHTSGVRSLTRRLTLGEDGRAVKTDVVGRFAALDREAHRFFEAWTKALDEERPAEYMLDDLVCLAVLGLQANYRVGRDEVLNVLGLFDDENVWEVCKATISWPTIVEMARADADAQKKTDAAGTPSG